MNPPDAASTIRIVDAERRHPGESMMKNLAIASALVLCAVTLRTGAIPSLNDEADILVTAATDHSLLDEQLGKLSFVSALFPEAVLVFGESDTSLSLPVNDGNVVHAWTESEPYISWQTNTRQVLASSEGEVIGVYHGNQDERIVQIMGNDGIACVYGNLSRASVKQGDYVHAGAVVGELLSGEDLIFEVRMNGRSIDPAILLSR